MKLVVFVLVAACFRQCRCQTFTNSTFVIDAASDIKKNGWEMSGATVVVNNTEFPADIPDDARHLPGNGIWYWNGVGSGLSLQFNSKSEYRNVDFITLNIEYFASHEVGPFITVEPALKFSNASYSDVPLPRSSLNNTWSSISVEIDVQKIPIRFGAKTNDGKQCWILFNRIEVIVANKTVASTTVATTEQSTTVATTEQSTSVATTEQSITVATTEQSPEPATLAEPTTVETSPPKSKGCRNPASYARKWKQKRTFNYRNINCIQSSGTSFELRNNNVYSITNMFSKFQIQK